MMKTPFEVAVREHGATVLRVCRAVLGATPDADDAWQETFISAMRAWPDLDEDANVEAWLVRIAHRRAIDVTRARVRRAVPVAEIPDTGTSADGIPDGFDRDLWGAVARLPERQRLSVAYHYLGRLPHTETAELIGGTPAAVRRAAADGVVALRRTWAQDHERTTP